MDRYWHCLPEIAWTAADPELLCATTLVGAACPAAWPCAGSPVAAWPSCRPWPPWLFRRMGPEDSAALPPRLDIRP
jgi:hypothetical protein